MISVAREEKIRKVLGMLILISMPVYTNMIKDDELKLFISVTLAILMCVLAVRKFIRDKKEGKPLKRYYIALGFIILSLAMFVFTMFSI